MDNNPPKKTPWETEGMTEENYRKTLEAKRQALEKDLQYDTTAWDTRGDVAHGGIDYSSELLAGGKYGKAAKGEDRKWYDPLNIFNTKEKKAGWSTWSLEDDMELKAHEEQTIGDLAYDSFVGGSKMLAAGFLDYIGSHDIVDHSNMAMQNNINIVGNWFQQQADKLKDSAQRENIIYQDPSGAFDLAYWANAIGQQLPYSGGVSVLPMFLEQGTLALTTGGAGNILGLFSKANKLRQAKALGQQALLGIKGGIQETYNNARETGISVYEKYKDVLGEKEAMERAAKAAHIHYKTEMGISTVSNTLQNIALLGNINKAKNAFKRQSPQFKTGLSDAISTPLEKVLPGISNAKARWALRNIAIPGLSEAVEEGTQYGVGKYAEHEVSDKKTPLKIFDRGFVDSAFVGAVSGILLGAGFKAVNKLAEKNASKDLKEKLVEWETGSKNRILDHLQKEQKVAKELKTEYENYVSNPSAENRNKLEQAKIKYNSVSNVEPYNNVINALALDYATAGQENVTSQFDVYVSQMQETVDAINNNDIKTLEELGLIENGKEKFEGSLEKIKNNYSEIVKDAQFIKDTFNDTLLYKNTSFKGATPIVGKKYQAYKVKQDIAKTSKDLEDSYATSNEFLELSEDGKKRFKLENELYALKEIDNSEELVNLSPEQKQRITEIEKELEDIKSYSSQDKVVLKDLNDKKTEFIQQEKNKVSLGQLVSIYQNEAEELSKPEVIIANRIEELDKLANSTNDIRELKNILSRIDSEGLPANDLKTKVENKIKNVKSKKLSEKADKSGDPVGKFPEQKPKKQDELEEGNILSDELDAALEQELNIAKARQFVDSEKERLGDKFSLEEVIKGQIEKNGFDKAKTNYNKIVDIFAMTEEDISKSSDVYNKFFNPQKPVLTEEQQENLVINSSNPPVGYDASGSPRQQKEVNQKDSRTTDPNRRIHTKTVSSKHENGDWIRQDRTVFKDSYPYLDPDNMVKGTKVRVQATPDHTIIGKNSLKWGDLKKDLILKGLNEKELIQKLKSGKLNADNLDELSKQYIDNIPIGYYYYNKNKKDWEFTGTYINTPTWFSKKTVGLNGEEQEQLIRSKQNMSRLDRINFLTGEVTEYEVTHRGFGSLDRISESNNTEPIKLSDLGKSTDGHSHIVIVDQGKVYIRKGSEFSEYNSYISNKPPLGAKPHELFELRATGYIDPKKGKEYILLPLMNKQPFAAEHPSLEKNLDPRLHNTAKYAVLSFLVFDAQDQIRKAENEKDANKREQIISINNTKIKRIENEYGVSPSDAERIRNEIYDTVGYNISKYKSIKDFLSLFLQKENNKIVQKNHQTFSIVPTSLDNYAKEDKKTGVKTEVDGFETIYGKEGKIKKAHFNVNITNLGTKGEFPLFNENGVVTETYESYNDLVREFSYTNVLAHKITGVDGKEKWISDVNPIIHLKPVTKESSEKTDTTKETQEFVQKEEIKEESKTPAEKSVELSIEEQINSVPEEYREELRKILLAEKESNFRGVKGGFPTESKKGLGSRVRDTEEQKQKLNESAINKIVTGFFDDEYLTFINSLTGNFVSQLDYNKLNLVEIKEKLDSFLENTLQPKIDYYNSKINDLGDKPFLKILVDKYKQRIYLLESALKEKDKITGPRGILTETVANKILEQDIDVFAQDFSKNSEEKDIKLSYSSKLKLFLSSIPLLRQGTNQEVTEYISELPQYNSPDYVNLMLLGVTTNIPSDINVLLHKLDTFASKEKANPIYRQLYNKIKDLPVSLQNELLYKTVSSKFSAKKVLIYKTNQGYSVKVIDENSGKQSIQLAIDSDNNFIYHSPLTKTVDNRRVIDKDYSKNYIARLNDFEKNDFPKVQPTVDQVKEFKDILDTAGLHLSENTLKEYLSESNPFEDKKGILHYMRKKLIDVVNSEDADIFENNIFSDAGTARKQLILKEINLNGSDIARSIRIGDKTLQGVVQSSHAFNQLKKLTDTSNPLLTQMLSMGYTKNNYFLNLIALDPKFREAVEISFASPNSLGFNGKDSSYTDTQYDKVSDLDGYARDFGLYTYDQHDKLSVGETFKKELVFRLGEMPFMTLSDKGRMIYLKTALLDLRKKKGQNTDSINIDKSGNISFTEEVEDFLVEQMFESEYNRILDSYKNGSQNINSFDVASKLFLFLPKLNTMIVDNQNIHNLIKDNDNLPSKLKLKEAARPVILEYINSEVNQKLNSKGKGLLNDAQLTEFNKEGNFIGLKNIQTKYVNSFTGSNLDKARKLVAEHAVNNMLHQANIYQSFLGDLAYYTKADGNLLTDGYIDAEKINSEYLSLASKMGEVVNKRSASLIAPGGTPANFKDKKHLQIQFNDVVSVSESIDYYVRATFNRDLTDSEKNLVNKLKEEYKKGVNSDAKTYIEALEKTLTGLEDYLQIKGTDAQEYTTWRTHMDLLFAKGGLTEEQEKNLKSVYNNMSKGDFSSLTDEERAVVMQPIKPVYSGLINQNGWTMRPVYIKASSIPLLPQLTIGTKLDNLRKNLEALETDGITVRASYQTANKIGSNNTKLYPQHFYDNDPSYFKENPEGIKLLESASVILDSDNLRIQQETPDKTSKNVANNLEDYVSMGSQFFKILGGNGIFDMPEIFNNVFDSSTLKLLGLDINKEKLSGEDLRKIELETYREYANLKMNMLYDKMGLNKNIPFNSLTNADKKIVLDKLVNFLSSEIKKRDYPPYLVEALNIVEDAVGKPELKSTLFLDKNANKFEALLQSIVAKELIFHKLPGYGHYSASSQGFEKITDMSELSENIKNGIIWTQPHSGALKSITDKDGKLLEAEVLVKSHFRHKGKLVDMKEYLKPDSNELDLSRIDEDLLSSFSFRTPTSSHQSGAILKVVGFLPPESGDMLVVPADHTTQIGEDYDIDKRTFYKYNYVVDKNGIRKITEKDFKPFRYYPEDLKELIREKYENIELRKDLFDLAKNKKEFTVKEIEELNKKSGVPLELLSHKEIVDVIKDIKKEKTFLDKQIEKNIEEFLQNDSIALAKAKDNFNIKLYENALIDLYKAVYTSPDSRVQIKIFKPLNTNIADEAGKIIESKTSPQKNENFSVLSDVYQRKLLKAGADGKTAIGVSSNAITIQAMFEKLGEHKKVRFKRKTKDGYVQAFEHIGGLTSDGILGKKRGGGYKSIDGSRDVGTQIGENQNVNTDNINKQTMGKRNENIHTMSVLNLMALRGFDLSLDKVLIDGKFKKIHIPSFFISQPIIKRYVEIMESNSSLGGDFVKDKELETVKQLLLEFGNRKLNLGQKVTNFLNEQDYINITKTLTGQKLYDSLGKTEGNQYFISEQQAILQQFMRFNKEAKEVTDLQRTVDLFKSSGLGVSFFEALEKIENLNNLPNHDMSNASELIGDYEKNIFDEERNEKLIKDGYTLIGDYFWKPTTTNGIQTINTLKTAYDLISPIFDYDDYRIRNILNTIKDNKGENGYLMLKDKYDIMSSMRDYLHSGLDNGVIYEGDLNEERERLFVQSEDNTSLAAIILDIKTNKRYLYDNPFIQNLVPEIRTGNDFSSIKHLKSHGSLLNPYGDYEAFQRLFSDDETIIGVYNGEEITPRKLGKDLVSYAMLSNSQGGATGFDNIIPANYLDIRNYHNSIKNSFRNIDENRFIQQYHQHKPNKAFVISEKNYGLNIYAKKEGDKEFLKIPNKKGFGDYMTDVVEFKYSKTYVEEIVPQYISVRNTKKTLEEDKQFNLYALDPTTGTHKLIPVLGTRRVNEYNPFVIEQTSLIDDKANYFKRSDEGILQYINPATDEKIDVPDTEKLNLLQTPRKFLEKLKEKELDKDTRSLVDNLLEYGDVDTKIVFEELPDGKLGMYDYKNNQIIIHPNLHEKLLGKYKNMNIVRSKVVEMVLEEIIHANTYHQFNKYAEQNLDTGKITLKTEKPPLFVTKLISLYNVAKESLPYDSKDNSTYYSKNIYEFMAGMFVAPDYRQKLEESNPGLVKRFLDVLKNMLGNLYTSVTGKVLSYKDETFNAVYDLLKDSKVKKEVVQKVKPSPVVNMQSVIDQQGNTKVNETTVHIEQTGLSKNKKLFDSEDKKLKKGSIVIYNNNKYLFWNNNNGKAQLINPDGSKFSGTPSVDKLTVLGNYATVMYNNIEYIVTDKNNVYSGATGKLVYTGNDNSSKVQKENIINLAKSTDNLDIKPKVSELFESNPELANEIYKALGFVQESNLPTENETINIYAGSNQNAELSNFAIRPFTTNVETPSGEKQYTFQSVEQGFHFYKAMTANNPVVAKQILSTINGGQLKRLTNRNNLPMTSEQVKEWDATSKSIMLNLMYDSYEQNPKAAEKLLATGDAKITHEGPYKPDRWTKDFPEVVMTVRDMLKEGGFTANQITPQQKQQAKQLYSQYLDTIFPDSKVKDIVYHGRTKNDELIGNGFHFGTFNAATQRVYGRIERELFNDPSFNFENKQEIKNIQQKYTIYDNVILNMQNPLFTKDWGYEEQWDRIVNNTRKNAEYDSLEYINQVEDKGSKSYVVFEPEQIHILGSKQDMEGFKEFVGNSSLDSRERLPEIKTC